MLSDCKTAGLRDRFSVLPLQQTFEKRHENDVYSTLKQREVWIDASELFQNPGVEYALQL